MSKARNTSTFANELVEDNGEISIQNVNLDLSGRTDAIIVPKGTTAQKPNSPAAGMIRYNTDYATTEVYNGTTWRYLDAPGTSSANPAPSAKYLYEQEIVTSGKEFYWIDTPNGSVCKVFCDFDTQDENGATGWMLVATFDTAWEWSVGATTTHNLIGSTYSGRQISANFGDYNCEMFRVCCNSSIDAIHGNSAFGDWYYYLSGGTSWKQWWAPATGFSYYNGFNYGITNDSGANHPRQIMVPFTHAHNIKWNYTTTQHQYNSLSDASANTSGYFAGGNSSQYWEALTNAGYGFTVYNQETSSGSGSSDGTLGILPQGYTGPANATGQDINACQSKIGRDDNAQNSSFGSSASYNYATNATGLNTVTGAMFWIK